jgi:hypothetical protein
MTGPTPKLCTYAYGALAGVTGKCLTKPLIFIENNDEGGSPKSAYFFYQSVILYKR